MFFVKYCDQYAERFRDYAALPLRVLLGIIFIYHGYLKLFGGLSGTSQFFASLGVPASSFFAVVVALVEFFGGIALLIGFLTRWASVLLGIDMIFAFFLVHLKNGFLITGGGVEFVLALLAGLATLKILGAQKLSVDEVLSKRV